MVSFEGNVSKANSAYGLYATLTSKELAPYIGKRIKVTIDKVIGPAEKKKGKR